MSDAIIVAIITNSTIIVVAILSRLWSHLEHRQTGRDVTYIKRAMNNSLPPCE